MSESDNEEDAPDCVSGSGSDWGQAEAAAADNAADDGDDDDVSMVNSPADSDQSNAKTGNSSSRKRKKPDSSNVGFLTQTCVCKVTQACCFVPRHATSLRALEMWHLYLPVCAVLTVQFTFMRIAFPACDYACNGR